MRQSIAEKLSLRPRFKKKNYSSCGRKLDDGILQAAFITYSKAIGRSNFKCKAFIIHDLNDQRPVAWESPDSVKNVGQDAFAKLSPGEPEPDGPDRGFWLQRG
jgi:hypothetical protein